MANGFASLLVLLQSRTAVVKVMSNGEGYRRLLPLCIVLPHPFPTSLQKPHFIMGNTKPYYHARVARAISRAGTKLFHSSYSLDLNPCGYGSLFGTLQAFWTNKSFSDRHLCSTRLNPVSSFFLSRIERGDACSSWWSGKHDHYSRRLVWIMNLPHCYIFIG